MSLLWPRLGGGELELAVGARREDGELEVAVAAGLEDGERGLAVGARRGDGELEVAVAERRGMQELGLVVAEFLEEGERGLDGGALAGHLGNGELTRVQATKASVSTKKRVLDITGRKTLYHNLKLRKSLRVFLAPP